MAGGMPLGSVIFWAIITFSILVVVHEGGHFAAARLFGVKVHEFMIGLPGPALRVKTKSTTFGVTMVPLGGYVRIAGMEPGAEDPLLEPALALVTDQRRADADCLASALGIEEKHAAALLTTLADWGAITPAADDDVSYLAEMDRDDDTDAELLDRARSITYRGRSTLQRVLILAAGVLVNLLVAVAVFTFVLALWGYDTGSLTVQGVQPGSAAAQAGVRAGDRIESIDGRHVNSFDDLVRKVQTAGSGARVSVGFTRQGRAMRGEGVLKEMGGQVLLGVSSKVQHVELTVGEALVESIKGVGLVFRAVGDLFRPSTFERSIKGSVGVVGIGVMSAEAAKAGPVDYARLIALLSLSLGVMNILPLPPLDGGKVLLEIVERLRGRPLKREVSLSLSAAGALLLVALIGYLVYADVVRYVFNG